MNKEGKEKNKERERGGGKEEKKSNYSGVKRRLLQMGISIQWSITWFIARSIAKFFMFGRFWTAMASIRLALLKEWKTERDGEKEKGK